MKPPPTIFADLIRYWDHQFTDNGLTANKAGYGLDLEHFALVGKMNEVKIHGIITCPLELKLTKGFISLGE